jgi:predicted enzyme related to lactoylglutathione lyase
LPSSVSAVLFAKDARALSRFYVSVFGASVSTEGEQYAALDVRAFRLVIHQIPAHLAKEIEIGSPPVRRESGAIRLDYRVADVTNARNAARQFGGQIDDASPAWAGPDAQFFLGFDSEGNVFGVVHE